MYKLLTVVGARPHFIKAAMVSRAIREHPELTEVIVHTGQHYDQMMSDVFFRELELPAPMYNLGVGSDRPVSQTARVMMGLDEIIQKEAPDLVIVYGDTNTTAAGAIAAAQNQIPIAHIEAGLREFDKSIPEEINKLITDAVADLYFCPTQTGVSNLAEMGIRQGVHLVGDVGIDLIHAHRERIAGDQQVLKKFNIQPGEYFLLTCHRAANTDRKENLKQILQAVSQLTMPIIWPMHPRTRKAIDRADFWSILEGSKVTATAPLGFWEMQSLLYHARATLTDSGGIIKEAYYHRVPGIIIDSQTEWIETVVEGWNRIVGPDAKRILQAVIEIEIPKFHSNCLGDGTAARKVCAIIHQFLQHAE